MAIAMAMACSGCGLAPGPPCASSRLVSDAWSMMPSRPSAFSGLDSCLDSRAFPSYGVVGSFHRRRRSDYLLVARAEVNAALEVKEENLDVAVETRFWQWGNYKIRYQCAGSRGPALILIHGFGANCDHWRKNIPVLAKRHRVFAIDLLGYGYSDKPSPREAPPNTLYTFETWARQVLDFCAEIVQDKAFLICNSVGGIVGLQAALTEPTEIRGLQLLNISLRLLHVKKQAWYARPFVKAFQDLLRKTDIGKLFFKSVATPQSVKKILCECYHDDNAVTDELVEKILQPGLQKGAVDVFLDFLGYSGGPLPEEMLPEVKCPVSILWGEKDPWEPVLLGQVYGNFKSVEEFVVLPNAGHCPQDEAPELVNGLVEKFVLRHSPQQESREDCEGALLQHN